MRLHFEILTKLVWHPKNVNCVRGISPHLPQTSKKTPPRPSCYVDRRIHILVFIVDHYSRCHLVSIVCMFKKNLLGFYKTNLTLNPSKKIHKQIPKFVGLKDFHITKKYFNNFLS